MAQHAELAIFASVVKAADAATDTRGLKPRQLLTLYELLKTYYARKAEHIRFPGRVK